MAHGYTQMSRFAFMSNAYRYLQRIAFIILCVHGSVSASAQQNWFLFIQSESSQPFYVRIGETIYNSSKVGHLVINGLHDSTYRLAIGFPQSQYREHQFSVPVRKKDHGFELKKTDARSWVLYDWQAQETIRAPRTDSLLYGERKKDDGFASLMASVVNDSAVLYASVVKADPPKKPTVDSTTTAKTEVEIKPENEKPDTVAGDTAAIVQAEKIADSIKTEPVIAKTETLRPDSTIIDSASRAAPSKDVVALVDTPSIAKLGEETGKEGKKLVFLENKKDTITVLIPLDKDTVAAAPAKEMVKENTAQSLMDSVASMKKPDTVAIAKAEMKKPDTSIETQKIDSATAVTTKEPEPQKSTGLVMINSDCVKFASDNDVDKLRIKMMNEKDAGNRVFVAHKVFKNMCFATRQIKALSELFPNDELKFRFFETAWPFVSDTALFKTLEETLTDQFFITRFRTLLRRQP